MPARLGRAEKLLLGVYLPAYLVVLGLHAHEVGRSGLAQLPVFVRGVSGDYPVVAGYPFETDSSGSELEPGDRLIQLGERDLSGVGYVGFQAIGLARTRPGHPAPLVFERAGERLRVALEARPHVQPWTRLPLLLLIPFVCVLVLLRAPGSAGARRLFLGAISYAFAQAEFYGGPEGKTWLAAVAFNLAAPVSIVLMLHWARRFPEEMPEQARVWKGWPWLVMALYVVAVRGSYLFGWPLPGGWVGRVSLAYHGATLAFGGGILAWNYAHAWAAGRRRLRWILLGTLLGALPLLATLSAPLIFPAWQGFTRAYAIGTLPMMIWMVGIVLAVVREQAFDVDRLIGATAAWSLAAGAAVATLAVAGSGRGVGAGAGSRARPAERAARPRGAAGRARRAARSAPAPSHRPDLLPQASGIARGDRRAARPALPHAGVPRSCSSSPPSAALSSSTRRASRSIDEKQRPIGVCARPGSCSRRRSCSMCRSRSCPRRATRLPISALPV